MEILQQLIIENELKDLKETILALHKSYSKTVKAFDKLITEGVLDFERDDMMYLFDEAKKRYQAALAGVKLANKLNDPTQKSRVWGNLNKLRAFVKQLDRKLADEMARLQQASQGQQLFQQQGQRPANFSGGPGQAQQQQPQQA